LQSWGVIPAEGVLTASGSVGGQVQTAYPDRPFFSLDGSGNVLAMGVSAAVSKTNGDIFSIHRAGSVVRFYKNPQSSVVPVPLFETSYNSSENFRFYAELVRTSGSSLIGIQPEWGAVQYNLLRSYKYTVGQQLADFGSAQSSIKVRVMQESALVGVGDYVEGNL